jgi:hypothetical protein
MDMARLFIETFGINKLFYTLQDYPPVETIEKTISRFKCGGVNYNRKILDNSINKIHMNTNGLSRLALNAQMTKKRVT